jgi:hypothetical protein
MKNVLRALISFVISSFRSRACLQLKILALQHQLSVYKHSRKRPKISVADRIFWVWLSRIWADCFGSLVFVKPETLIKWQRKRFREHWAKLSQGKPGRPKVEKEIRDLIRKMSIANPLWGSPRIMGELKKLGIEVAKRTIEKYMVKHKKPPSQTWKAFLRNHAKDLVSVDFFTVPTVKFNILFVFVVLANSRRKLLHFNITQNPTAQWTTQQIIEAFPWCIFSLLKLEKPPSLKVVMEKGLCHFGCMGI